MSKEKKAFCIAAVLIVISAALWGPIMSNVEQAKYTVIEKHGDIEIREYAQMIVAETSVSGDREAAISDGFRVIADYIFGNNVSAEKVAMTAPVIQQPSSEKIAMTAPVTQSARGKDWQVRFVMPASYKMKTLPQPVNKAVELKEIAASHYAVIRFSGMGDQKSLEKHTSALEAFIKEKGLKTVSAPTYAFFNPPWTLPPLRRNEVMVEIAPNP